jgi:Domain of unknown function (DUF4203)
MIPVSAIGQIIAGLVQLLLGRKLYWLTVGITGFLVGLAVSQVLLNLEPWWLDLVLSLGLGVIFAVLAVIVQRPMAALVGFFAFGIAAVLIGLLAGLPPGHLLVYVAFFVGGVIGLILVLVIFDWALIVSSAFVGSAAIASGFGELLGRDQPMWLSPALIAVLFLIGVLVQYRAMKREDRP